VSGIDGPPWTTDSDSCLASADAGVHARLPDLLAEQGA
jgi:hypothetical protein